MTNILKGIVFLLVVANVGYFLYSGGIGAPPAPPESSPTMRLKPVAVTPAPTAPGGASRCVSIGPFGELAESAHAQATLHSGGYAPRQRTAESEIVDGVLVYVPLPATPAAVTQLQKKLRGGGIADAAIAPGPGDTKVLSLGYFSDGQRAQARAAQARQLGLDPQNLERRHGGTVYWLDVDLKAADAPLNPSDFHADAAHGAPLEVRECPAAAGPAEAGAAAPGTPDASSAASAAR